MLPLGNKIVTPIVALFFQFASVRDVEREYCNLLRAELEKRLAKRKGYSLRAFSRDLEMTPAQLSRVLSRRRNISVGKAKLIAEKLFSSSIRQHYFVTLVEFETAKDDRTKLRALRELKKINNRVSVPIGLDKFEFIAHWYHSAIIAMVASGDFKITETLVSKKLGISLLESRLALKRLSRLGLLEKNSTGWVANSPAFSIGGDSPNLAIRQYHLQMLQLAEHALENQAFTQRSVSGRTFTLNRKKLPQLFTRIDEFRNELIQLCEDSNADSIYHLSIQLFDLEGMGKIKEQK